MYPMDFEEFLWAAGNTALVPAIREAFENRNPLGDIAHRAIMKTFREYMAVGGMPQAVITYVNGDSYSSIDRVNLYASAVIRCRYTTTKTTAGFKEQ